MMVKKHIQRIRKLLRDQRGQGMTEYGLILITVSIVSIAILTALGGDIRELFEQVIPLGG